MVEEEVVEVDVIGKLAMMVMVVMEVGTDDVGGKYVIGNDVGEPSRPFRVRASSRKTVAGAPAVGAPPGKLVA